METTFVETPGDQDQHLFVSNICHTWLSKHFFFDTVMEII